MRLASGFSAGRRIRNPRCLDELFLFHSRASRFENLALAFGQAVDAVGRNLFKDGIDFFADEIRRDFPVWPALLFLPG